MAIATRTHRRRFTGALGLGAALLSAALLSAAPAACAGDYERVATVYPGEVVKVRLCRAPASAGVKAWFGLRPVITVFDGARQTWFALVGIPLQQTPGEYIVSYHPPRGTVASRVFLVKPAPEVSRMRNAPPHGDGDGEQSAAPWWWEAPAVKTALAHFDDARTPQTRFVAPLEAPLLRPFGAWLEQPQAPLEHSTGIRFGASSGRHMVRSPAHGRVAAHINERGCDRGLLIDHGNGLHSVLCGLNTIAVEDGAAVRQRQHIATLDPATEAQKTLRWSVMMNRHWINPLSLVSAPH